MEQFDGSGHELPDTVVEEDDEATLAAIAQGLRDVKEGRVFSEEEVRMLVKRWNSEFAIQSRR